MKRWLSRLLLVGLLVVLGVAGAATTWVWRQIYEPFRGYDGEETLVEVRSGQGATSILTQLTEVGVLPDARLAKAYLVYHLGDPPLRAGEYRFDQPLSTPQVLDKLIRGEIVNYPVVLIEGLTLEESADFIARQGFGDVEILRREMARAERIRDLDAEAENLEGYLYPDTYHFVRGTTEKELVDTLVRTFRQRYREFVEPLVSGRTMREIVTLASIVEKEVLLEEERGLIAAVFANRLRIGMPLQADPTVIFAVKLLGTWDGNLRKPDLKLDSPYNTYVYGGIPPGPICSPAIKSLMAAASPADSNYLYFVSRNDGSHVFAETHREHRRNVNRWQKEYWRKRWAEERAKRTGP